jgi:two-component sensor histidine kinase
MNRYQDAYNASTQLMALKDSVFNQDKSAQLKDMQEKYETDIKDKQITNQQGQIDYNKKLNVTLAIGGACAALIALVIYFNLRKTARLNKIVSSQRDELAKQGKSLSLMMKELHHRVKNNLQIVSSLLNLQSLRLTDSEAISAVQESKQRVQAMSLIHQRLYKTDDITRINMKDYINELAGFLAVSYGYGPDNFTLDLNIEDEWTDIDKALPLGLILNELLTNAFKYAFKGIAHPTLTISFKHDDGNIKLAVKDNGTGMQPGQWESGKNTSFGRQLIKALCGQLRAKEKLEVANGTSFTYTIPEAA